MPHRIVSFNFREFYLRDLAADLVAPVSATVDKCNDENGLIEMHVTLRDHQEQRSLLIIISNNEIAQKFYRNFILTEVNF